MTFNSSYKKNIFSIKNQFKNNKVISKNTQILLNELTHLEAYEVLKDNYQIREEIIALATAVTLYHDTSENQFLKDFEKRFLDKLFELIMFKFIREHSHLKLQPQTREHEKNKKSDTPDFIFSKDNIIHYLECTTKTSSQFDKFIELILKKTSDHPSDFESFYSIALLFYKQHYETRQIYGRKENWHIMLDNLAYELNTNERLQLLTITQTDNLQKAIKKFNNWFYTIRYACFYYSDLISSKVLHNLRQINFPLKIHDGNHEHDAATKEHLARSVARGIIEKTKKDYFKNGNPVTLSISFSLGRQFLSLPQPSILIDYLKNNLPSILTKMLKNEDIDDYNIALPNLYAIIVDTCWYNWFPDITIEHHRAQFSDGYKNCYLCLYNEDHPLVKKGDLFYSNAPHSELICFNLPLLKTISVI